jgi:hypothetical protein
MKTLIEAAIATLGLMFTVPAHATPVTPAACSSMTFDVTVELADSFPYYRASAGQRVLVFGAPLTQSVVDLRPAGASCFQAGPGGSAVWGGSGNDVFIGGAGRDVVNAGAGVNTCIAIEVSVGC